MNSVMQTYCESYNSSESIGLYRQLNSVKQAYCEFLNSSEGVNLYRQFKRLLYGPEDSLAQWLNRSVVQQLAPAQGSVVRVCDIGGGDGDRIQRIISNLHDKFKNRFYLDLIEQSSLYAASFDQRTLAPFCETQLYKRRFEEVALPIENYDLVFLIHSIFAFENISSINKALSLRRSNGKIIVVSNSQSSFLAGLKIITDDDLSDRRLEITDVEQILQKLNIDFSKTLVDTNFLILPDTLNDDLEIIVNWISLGRFSKFTKNKKLKIQEYIESHAVQTDAGILFCEKEVALTIPASDPAIIL